MARAVSREEILQALNKPSPLGPDVDLAVYKAFRPPLQDGVGVEESIQKKVGVTPDRLSYLQVGETVIAKAMAEKFRSIGVIVEPLNRALKENKLAQELSWRLIDPRTDKYTAHTYLYGSEAGYFVYVPPGVKVPWPVYTCLSLFTGYEEVQHAHNVVYVDEGAEVVVTTGCLVPHGTRGGLHIGVSEFYVASGAKLVFTMLHSWGEGTHVRPRTVVRVEEGGQYISYYAIYSPVASIQTEPKVYLARGAHAKMVSVIAGTGNGVYDIGGVAVLEDRGSSAELISRVLASRGAKVYSRGNIEARTGGTKGHIECLGLLMDNSSNINAIPTLSSSAQEVELTHEAAIGMIAGEKIEYLMSKGFSEEEARALLIRGFLSAEVSGIPESVRVEIERIVDYVVRHALG
ncbi:SufD family Fe-S cluster assembly protein [Infirmifilum lucidum]|uniref:SufD family Fe-S cluster assembly protein n=1 Tax=Infirmifilum lucidum TaxID=2776706 RepID=A0A7L9FIE7_9CREN|nr:SufD family Fe-S cluster assembly protein [Infirmifilum lucidum]QOJ78696.1 SufD family Fe-S cluster assembly protein [Infirmifilum lucidum]